MIADAQLSVGGIIQPFVWHMKQNTCVCRAAVFQEDVGFSVVAANLPGVISEGDSTEEAIANIVEAFKLAIESYRANKMPIPWTADNDLVGVPLRIIQVPVELNG